MMEMLRERQGVEKTEKHDLFSSLLKANDLDLGLETLTEDEIISMFLITYFEIMLTNIQGNTYIFLVAGHEVS